MRTRFGKHVLVGFFCSLLIATVACTQGTAPAPPAAKPPFTPADNAAFMKTADEVLAAFGVGGVTPALGNVRAAGGLRATVKGL